MYTRKVFSRYLTEQEERTLFRHVAKVDCVYAKRDLAWMILIRNTGIRVGTMAGLTVQDAREALRTGYLDRRAEISKGGQGGKTYLTKGARRAMRDLLGTRAQMRAGNAPDDPLVISRKGSALSVRSYEHRMRYWCKEASLPVEASPHWLRHTYARRIMDRSQARDPRGIVQVALGHASINSTAIYTLPTREEVEEALEEACR